jgi:hypothetical protein
MVILSSFSNISEGIEFLIAIGSIVGLLGFILGLVFFLLGGSRLRMKMLAVILSSLILMNICGIYTGTKYFRLY